MTSRAKTQPATHPTPLSATSHAHISSGICFCCHRDPLSLFHHHHPLGHTFWERKPPPSPCPVNWEQQWKMADGFGEVGVPPKGGWALLWVCLYPPGGRDGDPGGETTDQGGETRDQEIKFFFLSGGFKVPPTRLLLCPPQISPRPKPSSASPFPASTVRPDPGAHLRPRTSPRTLVLSWVARPGWEGEAPSSRSPFWGSFSALLLFQPGQLGLVLVRPCLG